MNKYEKRIKYTLPQFVAQTFIVFSIPNPWLRVGAIVALIFISVSNYEEGLNRV